MPRTARSTLQPVNRSVPIADIGVISGQLTELMYELRTQITAPHPRKSAPTYSSTQVADLCGMDRAKLNYALSRDESLPQGTSRGAGRSRTFELTEARELVSRLSSIGKRPNGVPGRVLISANLKGGSTKTTTSMCLAQALSLRGRKVLLIDVDPQASVTELCGVYSDKEVDADDTVMAYIYDQGNPPEKRAERLEDKIQTTYWDGIDVIPSHITLFGAEFQIPALIKENKNLRFWSLLRDGLDQLRWDYDYIVIDSAPSLSYLTINAIMAADAIIMPLVPESLDFISSISFWNLFSDLADLFVKKGDEKCFDFVSVLLSKVEYGPTSSAPIVRDWAKRAYSDWLESIEIPASSAMSSGGLAISTVFDLASGEGDSRTLARVRDPLSNYARLVDDYYAGRWMGEEAHAGAIIRNQEA